MQTIKQASAILRKRRSAHKKDLKTYTKCLTAKRKVDKALLAASEKAEDSERWFHIAERALVEARELAKTKKRNRK